MIVGIDLGTTNSLIGIFRDGQPVLIPNSLGDLSTPSAVGLDDQGHTLVGIAARERAATHPGRTVQAFKRWMGTDQKTRLGDRDFRAEELSALVLASLKADAEAFLGEPVSEAVITVPAYFNEAQRLATRTAGQLAGLEVERLLNEPTAAGLAYGVQKREEASTFLIFDLGGGTFDVSVLEYFDGVVEVRASAGDSRLGGEDFVAALGRLFIDRWSEGNAEVRQRLWQSGAWWRAAEQAKRDLSERELVTMAMTFDERRIECEITRSDFEAASAELLQRIKRPIERALNDAQIQPSGLNEVVLVGGASRMPMIRQLTTRLFQRLPLRTIDPDLAVAQGAAIQAGLKARHAALEEVVLTDVMPYSLGVITCDRVGIHTIDDRFTPVIERNMPVPVSRMQRFHAMQEGQRSVKLDIRQGESPIGSENLHLGVLHVELVTIEAALPAIDVRFSYDANGLLEIDVRQPNGGTFATKVIQNAATKMSDDDVARSLKALQRLKRHPREEDENRYLLKRAKRVFADRLGEERASIHVWIAQFEAALDSQDVHRVRTARLTLRKALDSIDNGFRF